MYTLTASAGEQQCGTGRAPYDTPAGRSATVTVVIPTLNEAGNLCYVLPRLPAWVDEIIIVDGHSTDGTQEIARSLRAGIRVVRQELRGKGAALRRGCEAASSEIIVMLDADGSTDPNEIPTFVGALLAGADFVKGSRFMQGAGTADMPFVRKMGNTGLVWVTNILFGTHYTDITYGYNAIWSRHLHALAFDIDGWPFEIINSIRAARCGLRVVEVACFEYPRFHGEAKLQTFSAGWAILRAILRERVRRIRSVPPQVPALVEEARAPAPEPPAAAYKEVPALLLDMPEDGLVASGPRGQVIHLPQHRSRRAAKEGQG